MTDAIGQSSSVVTRSFSFNLSYPIANAPKTSIDERFQLAGATRVSLPVLIDWRPEQTPTTTYRLELSSSGGASWVNQTLATATAETFTQYLAAASGYAYRVKATNVLGLSSSYATGSLFGLTLIQENNRVRAFFMRMSCRRGLSRSAAGMEQQQVGTGCKKAKLQKENTH